MTICRFIHSISFYIIMVNQYNLIPHCTLLKGKERKQEDPWSFYCSPGLQRDPKIFIWKVVLPENDKSFSQSEERIAHGSHGFVATKIWGLLVDDLTYIICTMIRNICSCSFRVENKKRFGHSKTKIAIILLVPSLCFPTPPYCCMLAEMQQMSIL